MFAYDWIIKMCFVSWCIETLVSANCWNYILYALIWIATGHVIEKFSGSQVITPLTNYQIDLLIVCSFYRLPILITSFICVYQSQRHQFFPLTKIIKMFQFAEYSALYGIFWSFVLIVPWFLQIKFIL